MIPQLLPEAWHVWDWNIQSTSCKMLSEIPGAPNMTAILWAERTNKTRHPLRFCSIMIPVWISVVLDVASFFSYSFHILIQLQFGTTTLAFSSLYVIRLWPSARGGAAAVWVVWVAVRLMWQRWWVPQSRTVHISNTARPQGYSATTQFRLCFKQHFATQDGLAVWILLVLFCKKKWTL